VAHFSLKNPAQFWVKINTAARLGGRLHRLSVAPMLAEAILQLHHPCPNGLPAAANADSVGGF
jgi:hypothetical protein